MTDNQGPDSGERKFVEPVEYQIPQDVIENWNALPGDYAFGPRLARESWDRLYQAMSDINSATVSSVSLVSALLGDDKDKKDIAIYEFAAQHVETLNSLRKFQQAVMMSAIAENSEGARNG